ncbi:MULTISPECIES: septum formation initiator family protein [Cysteiniphilum]|uniref:Cell division protein FtsB n=1 Tax=Cysteiniphilum litorale TaxID=2056700 RepID=A0A8J2Z2F1_9GAMM|nr:MULTISPECIES: septum formation initiator family protein [Cysteiniphilum]GGF88707.1 cell division protein FtsB [Cysteiniphilum litorale]
MISRYTLFIAVLFIGIVALQYDFWWSKTGFFATHELNGQVSVKQQKNNELLARNMHWYAEIVSLRQNDSVLEGMARANLGFIKNGEVFYQIVTPQDKKVALQEDSQ